MEALWAIIGLLGVITGVDNTFGNVRSKLKQLTLLDEYEKEAAKILKDTNLTNQLLEAARNGKEEYAQMLLNSSPFGTRVDYLNRKVAEAKQEIKKYTDEQNANAKRQTDLDNKRERDMTAAQSSGSFITDVISDNHPNLVPNIEKGIKDASDKTGQVLHAIDNFMGHGPKLPKTTTKVSYKI